MKCPYCKEEIERNAKVCPVCSENIPVAIKFLDFLNQYKKPIISVFAGIVILSLLTSFCISTYKKISAEMNNPTYKTVIEHESLSSSDNPITAENAIQTINRQSDDLLELLKSKESKRKKNNVFITFYKNLIYYNEVINEKIGEDVCVWNPRFERGKKDFISGLFIEPIMKKDEYNNLYVDNLKILTPSTNYIEFVYAGEGYFGTAINYKYLSEKYSEYLGNDWKEYLKIKAVEQKDLDGRTLYDDGALAVELSKIIDWVVAWQNFQKKYPKFCLNKEVAREIKADTLCIMNSPYTTFEYTDDGEKFTEAAKKAYEDFLEKVDKKSAEYKIIQNAYEIIKKHDYKWSEEFREYYESI